ncbi:LysM peptidoglycan-binding domain-containing protein [Paenibacillus herberti]|uniref:LysM peptidoglycan-binding domain-containing protein n=1 Tax=Paenibacillus herberti TaxID=1619309 RepID=UPI0015951FA3|nr:LysM peptidoglycan-binding domain-containing protein [Paenibacillus herberti]
MKIHIVKKGDTLYLIGQKYGMTVEELQKLNPTLTNPHNLLIGTKVKVPSPVSKPGAVELIHKYKVKLGDTLWKLSKAWGVSLQELIKANPQISDPAVLKEGDTVHIPKPSTVAPLTAQHKAEPHMLQGGKKNTAPKPSTETKVEIKPEPPVEVEVEVEVVVEPEVVVKPEVIAEPVLPPPPVLPEETKVVIKPSYGAQQPQPMMKKSYGKPLGEAVHPFKQEKIPAVEALSPLFQLPKMPETASAWPPQHGYSTGYSQDIPGLGGANAGSYMYGSVAPSAASAGYGSQPLVGGAGVYSNYAMPVAAGGYGTGNVGGIGGYGSGVGGSGGYGGMQQYGMVNPAVAGVGDYYGAPVAWPANNAAADCYPWEAGAQANPYAGAQDGYGGMGYASGGYMAGNVADAGGYGAYGSPVAAQAPSFAQTLPVQQSYGSVQAAEISPGFSGSYSYGGGGTWQPEAALPSSVAGMSMQANPAGMPMQGYPTAMPTMGYPAAMPTQGYPAAMQAQGYPGGMQAQGYPGGMQAQGYPGGMQAQGYPGGMPTQGYPGGMQAQGYPAWAPVGGAATQAYGQPGWPGQNATLHAAGAGMDGYGNQAGGGYSGQLSPVQAQPCGCGDREKGDKDTQTGDEAAAPIAGLTVQGPAKSAKTGKAPKQRKPPKKAVIRSVARPTVRQSKGSYPWINQN